MEEIEQYLSAYNYVEFKKMQRLIVQDLNNNSAKTSVILKKYSKDNIIKYLEDPAKNQQPLRKMSEFLYNTSPNYKRLIDYLALLSVDNYYIVPNDFAVEDVEAYKTEYQEICKKVERYSLKNIMPTIRQAVLIYGVCCAVYYESKESFCVKFLDLDYCKISSVEDGNWIFSFDLDYFNSNKELLVEYGKEFEKAYEAYKGNSEKNIVGDSKRRWFEPKYQICVKTDNSQAEICTPYFVGLISAILEIDLYKEIKKDKAMLDNYKVLTMQIETDDSGMPKLNFEDSQKWYRQAVSNIPEGVGAIMTPFKMQSLSLGDSGSQNNDMAEESQKAFWENAGVSSLLFGIGDKPTSQSLELSIRPDESLVFNINNSIAKVFNLKHKKEKHKILFTIDILEQSRFNSSSYIDSLIKAASFGLPVKSKLMAAYGISPLKALSMIYLEDDVLKFTVDCLNKPLLQSSTMSPDKEGRPTNESKGLGVSDSTENNQDASIENR